MGCRPNNVAREKAAATRDLHNNGDDIHQILEKQSTGITWWIEIEPNVNFPSVDRNVAFSNRRERPLHYTASRGRRIQTPSRVQQTPQQVLHPTIQDARVYSANTAMMTSPRLCLQKTLPFVHP